MALERPTEQSKNDHDVPDRTPKGLTTSKLIELFKAVIPQVETQTERDEAYLNEAVDRFDLERRIRALNDIALRNRANVLG